MNILYTGTCIKHFTITGPQSDFDSTGAKFNFSKWFRNRHHLIPRYLIDPYRKFDMWVGGRHIAAIFQCFFLKQSLNNSVENISIIIKKFETSQITPETSTSFCLRLAILSYNHVFVLTGENSRKFKISKPVVKTLAILTILDTKRFISCTV